jgi:energy-coupling factor transporter ATP-binding protein EcfA2
VANALPSLKAECDLVTRGSRGPGVAELIDRVLEDDLKSLRRVRHQVALAETQQGEMVPIEPGCVLLAAGSSGGGKSTFLLGLMERLCKQRYQYCAIDPEGDYEHVEGAVVLGTAKRPPRPSEVMELLQGVRENAIVNLVGLAFADRAAFLTELFPQVHELRTRTARPHWIILDEAHHLLPAGHDPVALALPERMPGLVMVTVQPKQIAPSALERVDEILLLGQRPQELAQEFSSAVGDRAYPQLDGDLAQGTGLLWRRSDGAARMVRLIEPRQQRKRHARKYAEGHLPEERSFYFRGPENKLKLRAQNLTVFLQLADGVDEDTWMHHLRAGDYSRWFRDSIKDEDLAREAEAVELDGMDAEESRSRIREAVERRYSAPANPT